MMNALMWTPVVKRIPRACRHKAATTMTNIIRSVIDDPDREGHWRELLQFAGTCLRRPKRGGKKAKRLATVISDQITNFKNTCCNKEIVQNRERKEYSIRELVAAKISDADIRGAIRIVSSNTTILENNPDTLQKLQDKHQDIHPERQLPPAPEIDDAELMIPVVTQEDVKLAIKSFRNGSGSGPDRLLPQHLKDMTSIPQGEAADNLIEAITDFLNVVVVSGRLPEWMYPVFYGARLIALSKSEGDGLRPIAIGLTLRRLAGKIVMNKLRPDCKQLLSSRQLGVGVTRGAEIAVHSLRRYIRRNDNMDKVILKLDIRNAFNSMRRDKILNEVRERVPELYPMVWQSYAEPSNLYIGNGDIIGSREGVQQGDPLGPFLFCLGLTDLVSDSQSELSNWYQDDGTLAGSVDEVLGDLQRIKTAANELGLQLNPAKCELYFTNKNNMRADQTTLERFTELLPEVKIMDEEKLILLGAPILETSMEVVLRNKLQDLQLMVERLKLLDAHDAWFLLKHCLAIPRIMYTLRCSPCYQQRKVLEEYDHQLKIGLENILNLALEGQAWQQCVLPVKKGGLGIRLATELALPTFLSSAHATEAGVNELLPEYVRDEIYIDLEKAESSWGDMLPDESLQPKDKSVQASWDIPLYERHYQELALNEINPIDIARIKAVSVAHSSDWLNAVPIPGLGLKMDDAHFRIACGLRLGISMCIPYTCVCGELVDSYARHGLSCKIARGRGSRHSH